MPVALGIDDPQGTALQHDDKDTSTAVGPTRPRCKCRSRGSQSVAVQRIVNDTTTAGGPGGPRSTCIRRRLHLEALQNSDKDTSTAVGPTPPRIKCQSRGSQLVAVQRIVNDTTTAGGPGGPRSTCIRRRLHLEALQNSDKDTSTAMGLLRPRDKCRSRSSQSVTVHGIVNDTMTAPAQTRPGRGCARRRLHAGAPQRTGHNMPPALGLDAPRDQPVADQHCRPLYVVPPAPRRAVPGPMAHGWIAAACPYQAVGAHLHAPHTFWRDYDDPARWAPAASATFDLGWVSDHAAGAAAQPRYLGTADVVDWPARRRQALGVAPPHGSPRFEKYYERAARWYGRRKQEAGLSPHACPGGAFCCCRQQPCESPLNPAFLDLCLRNNANAEFALRRTLVHAAVVGVDDGVSAGAAGSHASNLATATDPLMADIWRASLQKELERGWIVPSPEQSWTHGTFLIPFGFTPKKPEVGPWDPLDASQWRLIRHYGKARPWEVSLNDRLTDAVRPNFLAYPGSADQVEAVVNLMRLRPKDYLVQTVTDLSSAYRMWQLRPALAKHYTYCHPELGFLRDRRGPFGSAFIGYYQVEVSNAILWYLRHVFAAPRRILFAGICWVDDFWLCCDQRHIADLQAALEHACTHVGFRPQGKDWDFDGCVVNQATPGRLRVWIGCALDLDCLQAQVTDRMRDKCLALLDSVGEQGSATPTDISQLTGRLQFISWTMPGGAQALRALYDFEKAMPRHEGATSLTVLASAACSAWATHLRHCKLGFAFGHFCYPEHTDGLVLPVWSDSQAGRHPGFGIFVGGFAVAAKWPAAVLAEATMADGRVNNNILEYRAHAIATVLAHWLLPGVWDDGPLAAVPILDSSAAEGARRRDATPDPIVNRLLSTLRDVAEGHFDPLRTPPRRVLSADCTFADALSRFDLDAARFWHEVARARDAAHDAGRIRGPVPSVPDAIVFLQLPAALIAFADPVAINAAMSAWRPPCYPHAAAVAWFRLPVEQIPTLPAGGAFVRPRTARLKMMSRKPAGGPGCASVVRPAGSPLVHDRS